MAEIRPFKAVRPAKGSEKTIAALPYDVYSRQEAKEFVDQHPGSFLAIDRPETQFPADMDMYSDPVYEKAGSMLREWIDEGRFLRDEKACYYVYEQTFQGRSQTGIVACASIDDYLNGVIKKHENTVEAKEEDRIRHVDACSAQTGPIFLAYRENPEIEEITKKVCAGEPVCDFVSTDDRDPGMIHEIRNRVWVMDQEEDILAVSACFAKINAIYIADGHHRCASAVKVGLKRRQQNNAAGSAKGEDEYNYFLSVLFPENELQIMDYNRVVKDLGGLDKSEVLAALKKCFMVRPCRGQIAKPAAKGEIGFYVGGNWYMLTVKNGIRSGDPVRGLDVSILQEQVLDPLLGIKDPRTDTRIEFVGGIRGLQEIADRADRYGGCAFAMFPPSIRELFAVADAGRLMPPKSTWFEPKLLSGLFIHEI